MTKKIELTQNQVALVDDDDFEWLSQYKWHADWNNHIQSFYAARNDGKRPFKKTVRMHREIMRTPKGLECDHVNHDTLDNRRDNLRNATSSQNGMNRRGAMRNNKLGERCISPRRKGFIVQVSMGGKHVYRKYFLALEDAIAARDSALKEHHGEFSS